VGDVLELRGLTRRYGDVVALDDLSFSVAEGQMLGFVGPNGAGKTTAMRIVLGVLEADAGDVLWRGLRVKTSPRREAQRGSPSGWTCTASARSSPCWTTTARM
jgi:ABC-2 type transport system ATP-binding protein